MNLLKNTALFLSILFSAATLTSCGDDEDSTPAIKGCTDPNSLNYNANATVSDGTCQYVADSYVGNYIAQDTTTYTDPGTGQPVITVDTYSFAIVKTGNHQVEVKNFAQGCNLDATVTPSNLTFTNPSSQCALSNAVCFFANGKLKYRYSLSFSTTQRVNGTAQKQQ